MKRYLLALLLLGGWDYKLSRTAHKAKRIGVPYVIVPLGDLSPWNLKHPLSRWWWALLLCLLA